MHTKFYCRVCGGEIQDILQYQNMPKAAQNFPDKNTLDQDAGVDLNVCQCLSCGLVQLSNTPVSYYKEVIRPIQYYLVKETNLFRTDERCKEIAELGRQISHRYNELRLLFIEIRLQYRTFSQTFSKTKDRLDQLNTK